MGLHVEYELVFEHLPLVAVADAVPDATLTVEVGQPNQGGLPPFDVRVTGAAARAVERAFEDAEFVRRYSAIDDGEGWMRYRVVPAATMGEQLGPHVDQPDRLRDLAGADSVVEHVEVTPDGWRQRRWFADRAAFERYRDFWRANAEDFRVRRLVDADRYARSPTDGLTDRQLEALAAAREQGYFAVPRGASLGEVADEVGISASSLSERLRRAQARLVDEALEAARDDGRLLEGPHH